MPEIFSLEIQNQNSPRADSSLIGQRGEELAARFLLRNGFRLVLANYKVPVGRNNRGATVTGEIDLIALDGETLCFVEVKTRTSAELYSPLSAIDLRKQRQIIRTARVYRKVFGLRAMPFRYDAVAIVLGDENKPQIEIFKNFWSESKFRKKFWNDEIW
jgi:putative endonuclease